LNNNKVPSADGVVNEFFICGGFEAKDKLLIIFGKGEIPSNLSKTLTKFLRKVIRMSAVILEALAWLLITTNGFLCSAF